MNHDSFCQSEISEEEKDYVKKKLDPGTESVCKLPRVLTHANPDRDVKVG